MEEDHCKRPVWKCQHFMVSPLLPKTYFAKGALRDLLFKAKLKEQFLSMIMVTFKYHDRSILFKAR